MLLTTDRLILREFEEGDWEAVLAYQSDPRYLRHYAWSERAEEDARAFVRLFVGWQGEEPRRRFQLAIVPRGEERLIGNCGLRVTDPVAREAEIGYELDPRGWGRGYATEAARAMLAFGFGTLRLHRVTARCLAENVASARVLERLGLRQEGRLREREWIKGRWRDTLLYAILDREWRLRARPAGVTKPAGAWRKAGALRRRRRGG